MTEPISADELGDTKVVIVDFGTGRFVGGHNEDYLSALEQAVVALRPVVVAPFRHGRELGRVARYRLELLSYLAYLGRHHGERTVIISHSPEFRDIALFWLAVRLKPWSDAVGLFLFRRSADGIVGHDNWRARFLERIVPGLIHSGHIYPVSDSRAALEHWTAGTGRTGTLIAIPSPLGSLGPHPRPTGGPVVGLVGRLRIEKGARVYDRIIREILRIDGTATAKVQVSDGVEGELVEIATRLRRDWEGEPRVEILTGHLTPDAYANLIGSTDVVVLPYDPATYGSGTSGVIHDTLALGRVVLATRIAWAVETFADRDDVIWLQGTDPSAIQAGLEAAFRRAMILRVGVKIRPPDGDFAHDWLDAIQAAAAMKGRPAT